jgi:histidyl-tRNA synthetase
VADRIEGFVSEAGAPLDVLERLAAPGHALGGDPSAAAALAEMRTLFELLGAMGGGALSRLSFDLSLARGLDYYTGLIYEAVFVRSAAPGEGDAADDNVGSIAAGGRCLS